MSKRVFTLALAIILGTTVMLGCGGGSESKQPQQETSAGVQNETKAEENAKWNIGDRHKATAVWPPDVVEAEKDAAWLEYRAMHPNRFHVVGLQRIWTKKTPPDGYMVVMSAPAEFLELSPPTAQELSVAVSRMRQKKRLAVEAAKRAAADAARKAAAKEAARKAAAEAAERKAGARKVLDGNTVRQQQVDEDLVL